MSNSSSNLVAKVLQVNKSNDTVTIGNKADLKSQAFYPPASGGTARLGNRMLWNLEFGGNKNRYIDDIRIVGNMKALQDTFIYRGGIVNMIEEIRLRVNDKNVYLVNATTSPIGLSTMHLWDSYTNYESYRHWVAEDENFTHSEKTRVAIEPAVWIPAPNANATYFAVSAGVTEHFTLPLSTFTNLFKHASCNHIEKISIEVLLKKGSGVGTVQESYIATNPSGLVSLNDIIELNDLEIEVIYDNYPVAGPFVQPLKGFLTAHDKYFEAREYPIVGGSLDPVRINLNDDYTPMENIKRIYLMTRSTTVANEATSGNILTFGRHDKFYKWELRRNGVKILECRNIDEWVNHIKHYFKLLHRHRTDVPLIRFYDASFPSLFIDLSRGSIDLQNDDVKTYKTINGLKNYTSSFGTFELIIYPNPAFPWPPDSILTAVACSTRLFHVSSGPRPVVNEEL